MNYEQILEFDKIKEQLAELAYTDAAKRKCMSLEPMMSVIETEAAQRETTEAKIMIEQVGQPPMTAQKEVKELVDLCVKGGCLTAEQLEQIAISQTAVNRMKDYLRRCKYLELGLPYFEENLDPVDTLRNELSQKIRGGRVDDYATKLLKSLRSDIEKTDAKMHNKADEVIRTHKDAMADSFSTMRNGHICIPVKKDCKLKVSGTVLDKSQTGNTLFIEPSAVAKLYDELQELRLDEENEERRILYTLCAMVADYEEQIQNNRLTIEKLDFIFAKAKISIAYHGVRPTINEDRQITLVSGRHPLMDPKICVPLEFSIGGDIRGIIITGPNTGGKTVAIKTVALNCMMAQAGLHVAASEAAICMNDRILCDIGDGQNISENLSTFSAHITNVLDILQNISRDSLVIMDELGSGTDPTEGMGIATAILDELKESGVLFLVTTHYPEIKKYAEREAYIVNARMTFDKESLKPLYRMVIGEAGESCALYIARKLGMPGRMLRRAELAAYGKETGTFNETKDFGNIGKELMKQRPHQKSSMLEKKKTSSGNKLENKFSLGDSVMLYPDQKIAIVCSKVNEKGALRIQLAGKKIWVNHKRVKLLVKSEELYPEDYDFSIVFDSVATRKLRHDMERKCVDETLISEEP